MAQHAPLVAVDRAPLGTICIDRQPRSQPQWRSGPLPGCRADQAAWDRARKPQNNRCDVAASCPHSIFIFAKRLECCADRLSPPPIVRIVD
jgi:hypothetical protein